MYFFAVSLNLTTYITRITNMKRQTTVRTLLSRKINPKKSNFKRTIVLFKQ